jgi:replicative DNA helicase
MAIDLNQCDQACFGCIKGYKKKHELKKGQSFDIACKGIPKEFVPDYILSGLKEEERNAALSILDPVTWAAQVLDWHCIDPDGEVWKRKNPDEYWDWLEAHPNTPILGKSRYHRPYQAEMLRCSSKNKVFRIGRQAGKTESIAVSILYHLFTKPGIAAADGFKIILITPYQSQIDLVFERLLGLIRSSPILNNSIRRSVKAPVYTLELHNSSIIRGFTAGTKSGGNAEAVRGQHGHMLVFDEADYLSSGDMDAALSIVTNYPNASVWMSSTPSGKREKFYQTCLMKDWKEFHYSSQVNPMWDERLETLFRNQLTEIGYKHEVLADFGEQEEGVFQNVYVQAAREDYEYGQYSYHHSWTYTIGVDWNDTKNGTTIAVLGWHPGRNKFVLVDRHIVSRDGWNQLAACQKVAEMNRIWKPISVYLDAGFGGTQYEVLRKFGFDSRRDPTRGAGHPDSRIPDILKQFDFGSKVETRDLFTGQPMKKDAKPFLIESAVRRFEAGDIAIPRSDESLEAQLLGYIIDRITPTGRPVYKANDETVGDHLLDAVMLSIMAFTMELTPIGKPKYESHVVFSGRMGERIDPEIGKGDTVIHADRSHMNSKEKDKRRPGMSRTETMEQQSLFRGQGDLPANHTHRESSVGVWRWDGFGYDKPKPKVRTLREAENDARKRMGLAPVRRGGIPRRKNI